MDGPDIIVGGDSGLSAIYFLKAAERKFPEKFIVRFILSRLALPPQSRHFLIDSHIDYFADTMGLVHNFTAVLDWRRRGEIIKIVQDSYFTGGIGKVPDEVGNFVRKRFLNSLQYTQIMRRLDSRRTEGVGRLVKEDATQDQIFGQFQYLYRDVLFRDLRHKIWNGTQVKTISAMTTRAGFSLDNGVPYPTFQEDYGLVLVDNFKDHRGDPEKLLRAAAFAGWGVVPESQKHRIREVAQHIEERRSKRYQA